MNGSVLLPSQPFRTYQDGERERYIRARERGREIPGLEREVEISGLERERERKKKKREGTKLKLMPIFFWSVRKKKQAFYVKDSPTI